MTKKTGASDPPAHRPSCVDVSPVVTEDSRQHKACIAIDVLGILSQLKAPQCFREDTEGKLRPITMGLSPKEEATYNAALSRLELYLDSSD